MKAAAWNKISWVVARRHYCYIILFGEVDPVLLQLSAGWQMCWALDSQVVDCRNVPGTCDLGQKRCLSEPKSHWHQLCSNMWCGSVSIKSVAGSQLWKLKFFFNVLKDWKVWRMMLLFSHADWWCSRSLELPGIYPYTNPYTFQKAEISQEQCQTCFHWRQKIH